MRPPPISLHSIPPTGGPAPLGAARLALRPLGVVVSLLLLLASGASHALNILLTNDDGFETANLRAMQAALKAAGHDVLVAAPTQNNSGVGGSLAFFRPLGPMAKDSRYGAVKAGAPGVGQDPSDPDIHYVDSTPVAATLYGLDVAARKRWGKAPDLVISGPNEGNNLGMVINSSGTVANALYAINRGIPAIAVSHQDYQSKPWTTLVPASVEYETGAIIVKLLAALEASRDGGDLLPRGTGLNVNIPTFKPGAGKDLTFVLTHLGVATTFQPVFYERLADSPVAQGFKAGAPLPGVSFVMPGTPVPEGVTLPMDDSADAEANVLRDGVVTVSVIEGLPEARATSKAKVRSRLDRLVR